MAHVSSIVSTGGAMPPGRWVHRNDDGGASMSALRTARSWRLGGVTASGAGAGARAGSALTGVPAAWETGGGGAPVGPKDRRTAATHHPDPDAAWRRCILAGLLSPQKKKGEGKKTHDKSL